LGNNFLKPYRHPLFLQWMAVFLFMPKNPPIIPIPPWETIDFSGQLNYNIQVNWDISAFFKKDTFLP
jgi:hypothetical protein